MDNGPKNRGKKMIELANKNQISIVYTTPGTPQHNFIEVVF